jgi:hypothetical protein
MMMMIVVMMISMMMMMIMIEERLLLHLFRRHLFSASSDKSVRVSSRSTVEVVAVVVMI